MPESVFSSPRSFEIWLFTVSHATLLLRSVRATETPTRIDVIFKPVRHLNLPTRLSGLDVRVLATEDVGRTLCDSAGLCGPGDKVFTITSREGTGWVVCHTMAWHEDEGSYADPSHFSVPNMVW